MVRCASKTCLVSVETYSPPNSPTRSEPIPPRPTRPMRRRRNLLPEVGYRLLCWGELKVALMAIELEGAGVQQLAEACRGVPLCGAVPIGAVSRYQEDLFVAHTNSTVHQNIMGWEWFGRLPMPRKADHIPHRLRPSTARRWFGIFRAYGIGSSI